MPPRGSRLRSRARRSIVKREAPYVIYPEILVIVDYDGYRCGHRSTGNPGCACQQTEALYFNVLVFSNNAHVVLRLHGGDNVQIKRYFVSFWNGVDLRYKLLKGPRIRISIAGIIISRVSSTKIS